MRIGDLKYCLVNRKPVIWRGHKYLVDDIYCDGTVNLEPYQAIKGVPQSEIYEIGVAKHE